MCIQDSKLPKQTLSTTVIENLLHDLGEHFIGLWIYKPFSAQGKRYWFVTFRDMNGQLWETDKEESARDALIEASRCLDRQANGEPVNPENLGRVYVPYDSSYPVEVFDWLVDVSYWKGGPRQ